MWPWVACDGDGGIICLYLLAGSHRTEFLFDFQDWVVSFLAGVKIILS
jgi:hypothetical protein